MTARTPKVNFDRSMRRLIGETPEDDRRDGVTYGDELDDQDRELIEAFIRAHDPADPTVPTDGEKSYNTLARYIANLIRVAERVDGLATADHDELNHVCRDLVDEGRSEATVRQSQMTIRSFYRFHDDLAAEPDNINTFTRPKSTFDDRDMLTKDEIEDVEQELGHPRDLAIFHLLLYTGQRVGSLRTLRVKDVAPEEGPSGRWWFNSGADGLKEADRRGGARPLLGAKSAVRDWLKYHPTGEPEHYLITGKPKYRNIDPTEPVTDELFRRMLKKAKEAAGVDKPMHPHMMRHNAVTIWKRDYEMPDETVKWMLGHSKESTIMETTYSHLSAEDHAEKAEVAAGERPEPQDRLSRTSCDVCGNQLDEGSKACNRCGALYTPDAVAAEREIVQLIGAERALSDGDLEDEDLDALVESNPLLAKIIEKQVAAALEG